MRRMLPIRSHTAGALATLALAAAGCAAAGGGGSAGFPPPPAAATFTLCNQGESGCAAPDPYSLATLRDLSITVNWIHVPEGAHTGTIEVLEPAGGLYQARNISFLADAPDSSSQSNITVPIAGSWIVQRAVTGQWSVRISLDGQVVSQQNVQFQP